MGNQFFKFKQFLINQDNCAMKVGTDSVLLACLTNVNEAKDVLDIGTGTGIIALMLAQKNKKLEIDAIEIDELAYQQAKENFDKAPFKNQITSFCISLQQFKTPKKYDLIITNPPYFIGKNNYNINDLRRAKARHDNDLTFDELVKYAFLLLTNKGIFTLVLPTIEAATFKKIAADYGFFCKQNIFIKAKESKPSNRLIMCFSKEDVKEKDFTFVIYNEDNTQTNEYKQLTHEYYL